MLWTEKDGAIMGSSLVGFDLDIAVETEAEKRLDRYEIESRAEVDGQK